MRDNYRQCSASIDREVAHPIRSTNTVCAWRLARFLEYEFEIRGEKLLVEAWNMKEHSVIRKK